MTFTNTRLLTAAAFAASLAFVAACSGTSPSMSPTAPTASASAASGANFSPNPNCVPPLVPNADETACVCPNAGDIFDPNTNTCSPPPPPPGDDGCTPGYWKGNAKKGADQWPPYSPGQLVGSVFSAGSFNSLTLLQALELGGGPGVAGATQNLLRAAVAAVLNAANGDVDYPATVAAIVTEVNLAIASNDRDTILGLASLLDGWNNLGCPIDNSTVTP